MWRQRVNGEVRGCVCGGARQYVPRRVEPIVRGARDNSDGRKGGMYPRGRHSLQGRGAGHGIDSTAELVW